MWHVGEHAYHNAKHTDKYYFPSHFLLDPRIFLKLKSHMFALWRIQYISNYFYVNLQKCRDILYKIEEYNSCTSISSFSGILLLLQKYNIVPSTWCMGIGSSKAYWVDSVSKSHARWWDRFPQSQLLGCMTNARERQIHSFYKCCPFHVLVMVEIKAK